MEIADLYDEIKIVLFTYDEPRDAPTSEALRRALEKGRCNVFMISSVQLLASIGKSGSAIADHREGQAKGWVPILKSKLGNRNAIALMNGPSREDFAFILRSHFPENVRIFFVDEDKKRMYEVILDEPSETTH
jgi:hypothetical protein